MKEIFTAVKVKRTRVIQKPATMPRERLIEPIPHIPRRIHQLWIPPTHMKTVPDDVWPQTVAWREAHPDFDHRLWTIDDVARELPPARAARMMAAVKIARFEAMKADIVRLYLLSEFGGFWSDLKVYPRRPWLDEHADKHLILIEHFRSEYVPDPTNVLINSFIGATPHHPYIEACIEKTHQNIDRRMRETIWNIAGPNMYMCVLSEWRTQNRPLPHSAILPSDYVWNEILYLGHGSYSADHRHWSHREKQESIYLDD